MGEDDDERGGQDARERRNGGVGKVMRFSRENRARVPRTRRGKIVTEKRKETQEGLPDLGSGLSREDKSFETSRLPPAPCGSAICQAGEYTTRDNGEVSQTLRTATDSLSVSRLTNARPSPLSRNGAFCMRTNGDRDTRGHARMISAPSGNGMSRDAPRFRYGLGGT